MWIVAVDQAYYPSITTYSTYEEALKDYKSECEYYKTYGLVDVYLTEVLESK